MVSPQFSSVKVHSHNHRRSKVAVIGGLISDVEVLPMVVKEGGCSFKVQRQHPGWVG